MASSSVFQEKPERKVFKRNFPLFKFQQAMKTCSPNKTPHRVRSSWPRGCQFAVSVTKQVSFQQKWQEMKQEMLAKTRHEGTVCYAEEPRLYLECNKKFQLGVK